MLNNKLLINVYKKLYKNSFISQLFIPTYCKKFLAFTLAEILVVLLILGTIAALTIPALVQNIQDAELKAAWKKSFSELSQAAIMLETEYGEISNTTFISNNDLRNKFAAYLSYTKSCDNNMAFGNCWHKDGEWKDLTGVSQTGWGNAPAIILSNGSFVRFVRTGTTTGNLFTYGYINVDVNGFKGPNVMGRDIFFAHVLEDSITPFGTQGDGLESTCSSYGKGCSALYLYQ